MTLLGKKIISLREKGMSFKAIAAALPCSLGTVHYHLTDGAKESAVARNRNRRRKNSANLKTLHGGSCIVCGYDKCVQALEFDHLDPSDKLSSVSAVRGATLRAHKEAEKCVLLCCRCHRERHAGMIDLTPYLT